MSKRSFEVDVPVKFNIWIRPELQEKQFEAIKKAAPSILFIQSDGGRNDKEWEAILKNRKMIDEGIDWDCTVYRLYEDHNNGLYAMGAKMSALVWDTVDYCIFLEDDDIPAVSFFHFCKELLEKYKDDCRIFGICGFNPDNVTPEVKSDYFFTGEANPWGTATWKRAMNLRKESFEYLSDDYVKKLMRVHLGNRTFKRAIACAKNGTIDGHPVGNEFLRGISRATQNALYIFPTRNLISNYGCGVDSVHSNSYNTLTRSEKKLFYSPVYEIDHEIIHPRYVIRDVLFEKRARNSSGVGKPFLRLYRRTVKAIKIVYYQGVSGLTYKFKRLKRNRHEK